MSNLLKYYPYSSTQYQKAFYCIIYHNFIYVCLDFRKGDMENKN